jgi:hypothetical protein
MITNKLKAESLKNEHHQWKKQQLDSNSYFIIFKDFLAPNILKKISGNALKLYIYLGLNADNMTGEVWHGVEKIAKYFDKSERTIRTWFRELQDLNLVYRMQLEFNGNSYNYLLTYVNNDTNNKHLLKYRLKDSKLRTITDLKDYSESIIKGVKTVFPTAVIIVNKETFSIQLDSNPEPSLLRKMGYEIKTRDYRFNSLIKEYTYTDREENIKRSTQLFQRIK